jgi:predicted DNA-binding transcriptional regulator YafY
MIERSIKMMYTNYKGETRERTIIPLACTFEKSPWHGDGERVWILHARDMEIDKARGFELSKCIFDY